VVLRTQMQAHYSADNLGHFGLNLAKYAHFTSARSAAMPT
jgi:ribonuclease R